ncbi:MAG: (d)CMP kinase [Firmicutes bacterium]|jgi:cytidylate kinase|nr:(d)CMP kinase [Bacillota bacterium]MDH7495552.1 (d)CMP kinase [Bacillota bacterium]
MSNKAEARMKRPVIAIDGPAGAGKSTVARAIAAMFGLRYVSTGHFYRAVALKALRLGVDVRSSEALTTLAKSCDIAIRVNALGESRTLLDGEDVTESLMSSEVDACVSEVALVPGVRLALLERQRSLSREGGVVMDGRDIGTVVAPDADVKVFLVATLEERVRRRVAQARERGCRSSRVAVAEGVAHRDRLDSEREIAPLCPAPDAVVIDTTGKTPEETIAEVARLVESATGQRMHSPASSRAKEERACST